MLSAFGQLMFMQLTVFVQLGFFTVAAERFNYIYSHETATPEHQRM